MQRTFICPKCRYPNHLHQRFCANCGEKLIADCPYCGSPGTGGYFCVVCGRRVFGATPQDDYPSMHLLALDQRTKHIVGLTSPDVTPLIILPAITTDGRLSTLPCGNINDFNSFQEDVMNRIMKLYSDCKSYVCVAVSVSAMNNTDKLLLVYDVTGSLSPTPEIQAIYDQLAGLRVTGDEYWTKVENFFSSEPQKSFINTLITHLKQELNWTQYVSQTLEKYHA